MLFINGKEYVFNENNLCKTDIASLLVSFRRFISILRLYFCFDFQLFIFRSYLLQNLSTSDFYLLSNGRVIDEISDLESCRVEVVFRLLGGKGGFGSMLRAIGAQIEKTTNREACRDLSGRRLRDINEEKRLKAWISQQAERERETEDRRKKRLERLCQKPKHEFKDETYDKERSELTDRVEDALLQGLNKDKGKRKSSETITTEKKKKPKLWLGSDEELSSTDEDEYDETKPSTSKTDILINVDSKSEDSSSNDEPTKSVRIQDDSLKNDKAEENSQKCVENSSNNIKEAASN